MRSRLLVAALLVALLAGFAPCARAHEVRPAYLEVKETGPDTYDVLWKVPGLGEDLRLSVDVLFPPDCERIREVRAVLANDAYTARWSFRRPGGLAGGEIRVLGLPRTQTDALVRIVRADGTTQIARLTPSEPTLVVAASPSAWDVVRTYTVLGVEHILLGFDHLLFVLALLIVTRGGWRLVKTVTAFTLSHGLTLSLATLGYVHVPSRPVEAVIALSIVFVAAEILRARAGRPGLTQRAPWLVALVFGLMHGLGFAGALTEAGLPAAHVPTALLFFSLGVEAGHLLFVGAVVALWALLRRLRLPLPSWAAAVPAYGIGTIAMVWLIDRTLGS